MSINNGDIVVALFLREDSRSFHWALAISRGGTVFYRMHARNDLSTPGWHYDSGDYHLFESRTLAAVIKIGNINRSHKSVLQINDLVKDIPHRIEWRDSDSRAPYNCRVWVRNAVRALNSARVIACPDALALEAECLAKGFTFVNQGYPMVIISDAMYSN
ncbi:hypothetical protein CVT26_005170 [Gymnopilus dilepis]|uniref:Uncharacterized protein n=1 Tax=Gymnopilus dilepis TaxID=231916 RepID=A0A409WHB5_9AGAR|nr:hypothetical protein CVT26_005170 [Gymnopilus dilepis]